MGAPLSVERTRMLLVLRINVLAKGHSGISLETLDAMIKAFNGVTLFYYPVSLSWILLIMVMLLVPKPDSPERRFTQGVTLKSEHFFLLDWEAFAKKKTGR